MTLIVGYGNYTDTTVTLTLEELKTISTLLNRDKLYTYATEGFPLLQGLADKFDEYEQIAEQRAELIGGDE